MDSVFLHRVQHRKELLDTPPGANPLPQVPPHLSSQGRAVKEYGFEVRAPTGQRSMTLPLSSERNMRSTYVPTWAMEAARKVMGEGGSMRREVPVVS